MFSPLQGSGKSRKALSALSSNTPSAAGKLGTSSSADAQESGTVQPVRVSRAKSQKPGASMLSPCPPAKKSLSLSGTANSYSAAGAAGSRHPSPRARMAEAAFHRFGTSVSDKAGSAQQPSSTISTKVDSRSIGKARAAAKIAEIRARAKSLAAQRRRRTSLELPRKGGSLLGGPEEESATAPSSSRAALKARARTPPPVSRLVGSRAKREDSSAVTAATAAGSSIPDKAAKSPAPAPKDPPAILKAASPLVPPPAIPTAREKEPATRASQLGDASPTAVSSHAQGQDEEAPNSATSSDSHEGSQDDKRTGANAASNGGSADSGDMVASQAAESQVDPEVGGAATASSETRSLCSAQILPTASVEEKPASKADSGAAVDAKASALPGIATMSIAAIAREIAAISTARNAERRLLAAARAAGSSSKPTEGECASGASPGRQHSAGRAPTHTVVHATPRKFRYDLEHPLGGGAHGDSSKGCKGPSDGSHLHGEFASPEPGVPVTGYAGGRAAVSHVPPLHANRPLAHDGRSSRNVAVEVDSSPTDAVVPASLSLERSRMLCEELQRRVSYPLHHPVPPIFGAGGDQSSGSDNSSESMLSASIDPKPGFTPGKHPKRKLTSKVTRAAVAGIYAGLGRMARSRRTADARMRKATGLVPKRVGPGGTYRYLNPKTGSPNGPKLYEGLYHAVVHRDTEDTTNARAWEHTALRRAAYRRYGIKLPPFGGEAEVDELAEYREAWWQCADDEQERQEEDDLLCEVEDVWGPIVDDRDVVGDSYKQSGRAAPSPGVAPEASWWSQAIGHASSSEPGSTAPIASDHCNHTPTGLFARNDSANDLNESSMSSASLDSDVGRPRILFQSDSCLDESVQDEQQPGEDEKREATQSKEGNDKAVAITGKGELTRSERGGTSNRPQEPGYHLDQENSSQQASADSEENAFAEVPIKQAATTPVQYPDAATSSGTDTAETPQRTPTVPAIDIIISLMEGHHDDRLRRAAARLRNATASDSQSRSARSALASLLGDEHHGQHRTPACHAQTVHEGASPDLLGSEILENTDSTMDGKPANGSSLAASFKDVGSPTDASRSHGSSLDESDLLAASPSGYATLGTQHVHDEEEEEDLLPQSRLASDGEFSSGSASPSSGEGPSKGGSPADDYDPFADPEQEEDSMDGVIEPTSEEGLGPAVLPGAGGSGNHGVPKLPMLARLGTRPADAKSSAEGGFSSAIASPSDEEAGVTPTSYHGAGPPAVPRHAARRRRGVDADGPRAGSVEIDAEEEEASLGFDDDEDDDDDGGDIAGSFVKLLAPDAGGRAPKRRQSAMPSKPAAKGREGAGGGGLLRLGKGKDKGNGMRKKLARGRQSLCTMPFSGGGSLLQDDDAGKAQGSGSAAEQQEARKEGAVESVADQDERPAKSGIANTRLAASHRRRSSLLGLGRSGSLHGGKDKSAAGQPSGQGRISIFMDRSSLKRG